MSTASDKNNPTDEVTVQQRPLCAADKKTTEQNKNKVNRNRKRRSKRQRKRSDSGCTEEESGEAEPSFKEPRHLKKCEIIGEVIWEGVSEDGGKIFCIEKGNKKILIHENSHRNNNSFDVRREQTNSRARNQNKSRSELDNSQNYHQMAASNLNHRSRERASPDLIELTSTLMQKETRMEPTEGESSMELLIEGYEAEPPPSFVQKSLKEKGQQFIKQNVWKISLTLFCGTLFLSTIAILNHMSVFGSVNSDKRSILRDPPKLPSLNLMRLPPIRIAPTGYGITENMASSHTLNSDEILIFLGGERGAIGTIVDTVEIIHSSRGSSFPETCDLPGLPKKLKWGNARFAADQLVVCGGQTASGTPNHMCWALEESTKVWTNFLNLTR